MKKSLDDNDIWVSSCWSCLYEKELFLNILKMINYPEPDICIR